MGKLNFIIGRSKSGKTTSLMKMIKIAIENRIESPMYLIVPDQATFLYESLLMDSLNGKGFIDIEVLSFSRLVERVIENSGIRGEIPIDSVGKSIILGKVMRNLKSSGEYFGKASESLGFLAKMTDTLDEFAMCGIDASKLQEVVREIEDDALKFKMEEISKVYEGYSKASENIYCDVEKAQEIVGDIILKDGEFSNSRVFVDGFFSYSHQEKQILKSFLQNSGNVCITSLFDINYENIADGHIFEPSLNLINEFKIFAFENNMDVEIFNSSNSNEVRPRDIRHLESNIYSWPGMEYDEKVESINIEKCKNVFDEVERTAVRISKFVRDEGASYSQVSIICGDIKLYAPIIKRMFRDFEIPVFIDDKRPIKYYPIVKAITAALETINANFGSDSIYRLMKSGMFDLRRNQIEKLELYAMENGIRYNKWLKPLDIESLEEIRKWLIEPLEDLKAKVLKKSTAKEFTLAVFEYMDKMSFSTILKGKIQYLTEKGELEVASEYAQAWNGVIKVFDQVVEVCGDYQLMLKEYIDMLKDGFDSNKAGIVPVASEKVVVGDLQRSIFGEVDHLFVLGFNDGNIPSISTASSIISSKDKELLRKYGVKLNSEISEINKLETLRIYNALSGPKKSLTLSYTISKLEGEASSPSLILERLFLLSNKIFKNIKINGFHLDSNLEKVNMQMINNPLSTLKKIAGAMGNDGFEQDSNAIDALCLLSQEELWQDKIDFIFRGRNHDNSFDYIDESIAPQVFKTDTKASISRLEKFRKCPFSHLVRYGLRPNEQKEFEIKSEDLGNVYHKVMERFGEEILKNQVLLSSEKTYLDKKVDEIVDDEILKLQDIKRISTIFLETGIGKYAVRKMKRYSKTAASAMIEHIARGEFMPKLFEAKFGNDDESILKPIVIDCGEKGTIILEGRIDRIDIADSDLEQGFVRIIDYKSGNLSLDASEIIEGTKLQLIHYLNAAVENAKLLGYQGLSPGGAFYFRINDPLISKDDFEFQDLKSDIKSSLTMSGITVSDDMILRANDKYIEDDGELEIISDLKKELKKASKLGSSKVLSSGEINSLIKIAKNKTSEICKQILEGYTKINPIHDGTLTACNYCDYSGICQFDSSMKGNEFAKIRKYTPEEIKKILNVGEGVE